MLKNLLSRIASNIRFNRHERFFEFYFFDWSLSLSRVIRRVYHDRFSYQKQFIRFNIKEGDKVLDIGCGVDPFPLATHLTDLYLEETSHRPEGSRIDEDPRPFVVSTIERTPFKDRAFDFVYCSHTLEHLEDPAAACEELMRIGKRGYIETPTRMSDIVFNFTRLTGHHLWHITLVENTLVFLPWRKAERRDTMYNELFELGHASEPNPFQRFFNQHRDLFSNMFLWEHEFDYIIVRRDGSIMTRKDRSFPRTHPTHSKCASLPR